MSEQSSSKEANDVQEKSEHAENDIERARRSLEKEQQSPEKDHDVHELRQEIDKHLESETAEKASAGAEKAPQQAISVSDKKQSYSQTMQRVRSRMNPLSSSFSSFIHAPVIEQTSELIGKTVARPSGIIGGSMAVIIGLGVVGYLARRNGFALSGSEFLLLLLIGFIVGLIVEALGRIFHRRRN